LILSVVLIILGKPIYILSIRGKSVEIYLSLFLLKEKVTKKFKENTIAPRVFPGLRVAKAGG